MNFFRSPPPTLLERTWQIVANPINVWRARFDTLFSTAPALSFLLIPTFSSYSTSFNLLFFYLTWSILILSNSPLKVEFYGTLAIKILFYVLPSLGFLLFDSALPGLAVKIKEHGEHALALSEDQRGWKGRWWKVALVSIGNIFLGVFIQLGIEYLFTEILHVRSALKATTSVPMPWSIAKDLIKGFILREALTYMLHRYVLHSRSSPLAQYHADWFHSLPAIYSLSANYDHPLAYLVRVFLPTYLPALLFRFHLLTYNLFLTLISLEETFAYSGYNVLPSGLILGGIARRQERHLMDERSGNFGCWGLVDFCTGTSLGQDVVEDVRDEVDRKEVAEKTKGNLRRRAKRG